MLHQLMQTFTNPDQYCFYGDQKYPPRRHIIRKHLGRNLTVAERMDNMAMNSIRVANEWCYGLTLNLFPYVRQRVSLRKHKDSFYIYIVATMFRNFHSILYGSIVQRQFYPNEHHIITLENYLDIAHIPH